MEEENKRPMTDSTTILIIEDDADLLDGLSFSLASEGYQVQAAATAREGLRLFRFQELYPPRLQPPRWQWI